MGERLAPTAAERFVGRAHELAQVASVWGGALRGQGSMVVVSGEPGVGKTRLCQEAANRARAAGLKVVTAWCSVHSGAPALWPWQVILPELCGEEARDLLASDAGSAGVGPERFERFAAVTERLASVTTEQPVCLVIDDLHAADAGTLLLVRFVARSLHNLPLALVVSRRSGEPADSSYEAELLDDIESDATPLVLQNFDRRDAEALLAVHGLTDLEPDLMFTLFRVTGGNPLFLRRIAALGAPRATAGEGLPSGLQAAIEEVSQRLSPEVGRVLQESAVLGLTPSVQEAVAVARTDVAGLLDAVAEATPTGLVTAESLDRFTFGHELVRAAFEGALTSAERMDAYARAAVTVGGGGDGAAGPSDRLTRRAHYAMEAARRSTDDALVAVSACREAALSMMRSFAYEQADRLLSAAVEIHDRPSLGAAPSELLVEWALAALACGWTTEAQARFDQAAAAAQREGNPVMLAEAALGLGGHGVYENRALVDRARVLGLQRAALDGLPEGEDHANLRLRLEARLAAEAVYDGGSVDAVYDALDRAREHGDPSALAEVLALCHHVSLTPEHAQARLALADELVRVASEAGYGVLGLAGLHFRAFDLFHLGDERALPALEELRGRAAALGAQHMLYLVAVMDVTLLFRAGRLDEAEAQARRCRKHGEALGEANAVGYLGAQTLGIHWARGSTTEQVETAEKVAASPTLVHAEVSFRAVASGFAARAGQHERARAILDQLTAGGLASLPRSSSWMVSLAAIADAAAVLGDADIAAEAYDLLLPYAGMPTVGGFAVICLGSTERALGVAALAFGDHDRAIGHLERALSENRRLENRPLLAIARADLARALGRRGGQEDRSRAAELLDQAIAEGDEMGMTARTTTWRAERSDLDHEPGPRPGAGSTGRHGLVHQVGNGWLVTVDDHVAVVGDLIGMRYLSELLTRPGQLIPAMTLASQGMAARSSSRQELLDDAARAAYGARAQELTSGLAEAEANNDLVRAETFRVELDALVGELEAATGLGGRARAFTQPTERARSSVSKAIKRAIDAIGQEDPAIGGMLRPHVTTGTSCSYAPPHEAAITWSTRGPTTTPTDPPPGARQGRG